MADINQTGGRIVKLKKELDNSFNLINGSALETELSELKQEMALHDFWKDNQRATQVSKKFADIEQRLSPWLDLKKRVDDLWQLSEISDETITDELEKDLNILQSEYNSLKNDLRFTGKYDAHDAIISIFSGAGGTDAQDWAEMLERMYLRWAERNGIKVEIIERAVADEAGIKSASLIFNGPFAFGKLKSERGVHRLVRLSPFNSDNLRQTSFAKVDVTPKIDSPSEVVIDDKDLKIDVFRSGGKGGQSVNTTDSAVRITHIPTGIVVAIQNERSQLQNRETAITILKSKLAQLQMDQHAESLSQLKGPNEQAAWGNQIRSYVLHPYRMVKDLRSGYETSDTDSVLAGDIDGLINAYLESSITDQNS